MLARSEVSAGVLLGGGSTRMGQDKATLPWGSSTLLQHTRARLDGFAEVLLSTAPGRVLPPLDARLVPDAQPGFGPLEGLHRLLCEMQTDWLFVCAVDLPLWDAALPHLLLQHAGPSVCAIVPTCGGRTHPLCALYSRTARPALEACIGSGEHRVMAFLRTISVRYVDLDAAGLPAWTLENANTPEAYARCRAITRME